MRAPVAHEKPHSPTHLPVQALAVALLAKVVAERVRAQEPDERVQFSHSVLQRCTGKTPLVLRLQGERGFGGVGGALLDVVCLVEDDSGLGQLRSYMNRCTCNAATSSCEKCVGKPTGTTQTRAWATSP